MEIDYISLPKLKREIRRADLTGDQVFLCCMPRPAVPLDQPHNMQDKSDNDGLDPVRHKLPIRIHKWAGLYDQERAEFGDLPPHPPGTDHGIRLHTEANPPWVQPYKTDPSELDELQRQLDKLHRSGQIRPSSSRYGLGCLLLRKANGKWRMCVQYRALNTRTLRDRYPLPLIQSRLSTRGGSTVFSKIDLVSGFPQIRIHDKDTKKLPSTRSLVPLNGRLCPLASAMHHRHSSASSMMLFETTWGFLYGCISMTSSSSRRMPMNTNNTSIWCMNCYSDTSYFPVSTDECSSSLEFLFADTPSIRMEYTWTLK